MVGVFSTWGPGQASWQLQQRSFGRKLGSTLDTDAMAIGIAIENARLNSVSRVVFRVGGVEEGTASADCVCANLTADTIIQIIPTLIGVTCGRLILSGVLDTQRDSVLTRLQECGVSETPEITSEGEWVCIVV